MLNKGRRLLSSKRFFCVLSDEYDGKDLYCSINWEGGNDTVILKPFIIEELFYKKLLHPLSAFNMDCSEYEDGQAHVIGNKQRKQDKKEVRKINREMDKIFKTKEVLYGVSNL